MLFPIQNIVKPITSERLIECFDNENKMSFQHKTRWERVFGNAYRCKILPILVKKYLFLIFRKTGLDSSYLFELNRFLSEFECRPMWNRRDLNFYKNVFRILFSDSSGVDGSGNKNHIAAWQRPEVMYQLLHSVERYSDELQVDIILQSLRLLGKTKNIKACEFGCGFAPLANSVKTFGLEKRFESFAIADVQSITFLFPYKKFCSPPFSAFCLVAENDFRLDESLSKHFDLDIIFCVTVIEHLPNPISALKDLISRLRPNGVFCFDFILGDGEGYDSVEACLQRADILNLIGENFVGFDSEAYLEKSLPLTFLKKKL